MALKATKKCAKVLNSENSFLYLALSVLSEEGYPSISAICAVIGPTNFLRLVTVLGGANLKIPSSMELSTSVVAALYLYHLYVESMSEKDFIQAYEIDLVTLMAIKKRAKQWIKSMKDKGINVRYLLQKAVDLK